MRRKVSGIWNGQLIRCAISIGYASFTSAELGDGQYLDAAISLVDKALYMAKRRG